jgi:hypothetical protein
MDSSEYSPVSDVEQEPRKVKTEDVCMAQAVQGLTAPSTDDVVDSVPWALLTSSKRDFGDGGESSGRGAPIPVHRSSKKIQCYRHCKEWVVKGPNPLHHHTHQQEVHMQMYI